MRIMVSPSFPSGNLDEHPNITRPECLPSFPRLQVEVPLARQQHLSQLPLKRISTLLEAFGSSPRETRRKLLNPPDWSPSNIDRDCNCALKCPWRKLNDTETSNGTVDEKKILSFFITDIYSWSYPRETVGWTLWISFSNVEDSRDSLELRPPRNCQKKILLDHRSPPFRASYLFTSAIPAPATYLKQFKRPNQA